MILKGLLPSGQWEQEAVLKAATIAALTLEEKDVIRRAHRAYRELKLYADDGRLLRHWTAEKGE